MNRPTSTYQDQLSAKELTASKVFLEGPAGAGKTTAAVQRLLRLLKEGTPGGSTLVLVPQRTLATPYSDALRRSRLRAGGLPSIQTAGGLARRMVELFWPLAAGPAGFADPDRPPTFLTLETAQYHMAHLVRPLLDDGYFESITIDRNRLYSQIIDNLNKAAVVGFPHSEIGQRLTAAWNGDPTQVRVYADAQQSRQPFPRALSGPQPAGLLAAGRDLLAPPVAAAHLPRASASEPPPPHRGQRGGGHPLRPRPAG